MKTQQVVSAVGLTDGRQYLMKFLINDCIALDAGCPEYCFPISQHHDIFNVRIREVVNQAPRLAAIFLNAGF